ncbi:MAG: hypothetical protein FJ267_15635, partial [Planctomycetes bacterium]|nr:hypothetical protein [Planctomycetota bacterium]
MTLTFEPIWPWPIVLVTSVALLTLAIFAFRVQRQSLPGRYVSVLLTLRLLSLLALIFAMLRPAFQKTETDETPTELYILTDVSRSMNTDDMPNKTSRFQAIRSDIELHKSRWKDFGKRVEIRLFDFGQKLAPYDPELAEGYAEQTAFGRIFEDIKREVRDRRTLGIILMTEGANRAIPPDDIDPLTAARDLAEAQVPIYAVCYGTSSLASSASDFAIEDLVVPEIVFERNRVSVKAKLRTAGANGKKAFVRILLEDRSQPSPGKSGELKPASATAQAKTVQEVEIKQDTTVIPIDLS